MFFQSSVLTNLQSITIKYFFIATCAHLVKLLKINACRYTCIAFLFYILVDIIILNIYICIKYLLSRSLLHITNLLPTVTYFQPICEGTSNSGGHGGHGGHGKSLTFSPSTFYLNV